MSWILGYITEILSEDTRNKLSTVHPEGLHFVNSGRLYIAAGGIPPTCLSGRFPTQTGNQADSGWIVCGLGIRRVDDHCVFLSSVDWESILSRSSPQLHAIDGHFVACRWDSESVEIYSDQLGQRTLFVARTKSGMCFSTRIDWLAQFCSITSIDFREFGSKWLTFNQLTYGSDLRQIERIGPGGYGRLTTRTMSLKSTPWTPRVEKDVSPETFLSSLSAFTNPTLEEPTRLSLGLSGGLDSRLLLSILLHQRSKFEIHVFGDEGDPDVQISNRIVLSEGLSSLFLHDLLPDADKCMLLLRDYAAQAGVCVPATQIMRLGYYDVLNKQQKIMIDGGFGELARRQYLNRLLLQGKSALKSGNPKLIMPFLAVDRGEIFSRDVKGIMISGVKTQIEEVLRSMPSLHGIDVENYLDLFSVRTRVPNYGSQEQARIDSKVRNYMPYKQPSLLNLVFSLPVSVRSGGKMFRKAICQNSENLAGFPLAKSGTTYPFRLKPMGAWIWTTAKARLGMTCQDTLRSKVLESIRPFVLDSIESASVRTYGAYDHARISRMVSDYYGGKRELAGMVDWWLTFELWRQSVKAI